MDFITLVDKLKEKGYKVVIKNHKLYKFAKIDGKNITGGFCSKHDENNINSSYSYINGKISIDHKDCFDKWSKCPLVLEIPSNKGQMNYLLKQLEFWGSDEGYKISNQYEFEQWVNSYPDEI